jgi:C-terminal processing protease CtpA/Prc
LNEVFVNFPDSNSYSDTTTLRVFRNGTMGGGVLCRFTVIYDFPNEKVYVKKNGNFKGAFHYNVSGLTIRSTGKGLKLDEFEIVEVREGSAGHKAGLKKGDRVISVNGIHSGVLKLSQVMARLSQKPGKKVRMEVQRDGKRIKTAVILSDQI